jgi:hypothetical protein
LVLSKLEIKTKKLVLSKLAIKTKKLVLSKLAIKTKDVSLNPVHGKEVYSIQHYVIKFVSDLGQVGGFLWVLWFPPTIKLTATI